MKAPAIPEGEMIALAASGNVGAQIWMAEACQKHCVTGKASQAEALAAAEAFARLAAANNVFADVDSVETATAAIQLQATATGTLASILFAQADRLAVTERERAEHYAAEAAVQLDWAIASGPEGRIEAASLLAGRADAGNDDAAIRLNKLLAGVSREEAVRLKASAKQGQKARAHFDAEVATLAGVEPAHPKADS